MTRLLSALVGALLGCALLWLVSGGRVQAHPLAVEQGANLGRLQLHGELLLHYDQGTQTWSHIDAVCDTGNGMLLYLVQGGSRGGLHVEKVPNGCQKAQAER